MSLSADSAETVALQALAWLVANDELLPVFLGSTGASSEDLKAQASDPAFLASVLDFLTMDDAWVVAFCDAQGFSYEMPMMAAQVLSGASRMHWT